MKHIGQRFEIASTSQYYDLVVVTQGADLSQWMRYSKSPMVFDFNDPYLSEGASLTKYLRGTAKFITRDTRYFHFDYKKLLEEMCSNAQGVICSTKTECERIEKMNRSVWAILDSPEEFANLQKTSWSRGPTLNLLWEGLPESIKSFSEIRKVLKKVACGTKIKIFFLTNQHYYKFMRRFIRIDTANECRNWIGDIDFEILPWTLENFKKLVDFCDVALVPMYASRLHYAKPANRILYFMRAGIPVLGGRNESHCDLSLEFDLNLFCDSPGDWEKRILKFATDEAYCEKIARKNQEIALKFFSEKNVYSRWAFALDSVMNDKFFSNMLTSTAQKN
jgi:hypothetical protein